MKKMLFETCLGLVFIGLGIYVGYVYLNGIDSGSSPWLLGLGVLLVGVGAFFLLRAGSTNVYKPDLSVNKETEGNHPQEGQMAKNSRLIAEWNKTEEEKERLRMLSLRAEEEEKSSQGTPNL